MKGKDVHMSLTLAIFYKRAVDLTVLSTALHTATNSQLGLASEMELATLGQIVSTSPPSRFFLK